MISMVSKYICRVSSLKWSCRIKNICIFNFDRYCQMLFIVILPIHMSPCDGWEWLFPYSLTKQHVLSNFYIFANIFAFPFLWTDFRFLDFFAIELRFLISICESSLYVSKISFVCYISDKYFYQLICLDFAS